MILKNENRLSLFNWAFISPILSPTVPLGILAGFRVSALFIL